jgi:hypothetical protein
VAEDQADGDSAFTDQQRETYSGEMAIHGGLGLRKGRRAVCDVVSASRITECDEASRCAGVGY